MNLHLPINSKAQLDYIFIKRRHTPLLKEYLPITESFQQSLYRNKKQIDKASQYDGFPLANSDISNQYSVTVRNKFDTLQETSERHSIWQI